MAERTEHLEAVLLSAVRPVRRTVLPAQTLASSSKRMQPTLSSDKSCTMPRTPPSKSSTSP